MYSKKVFGLIRAAFLSSNESIKFALARRTFLLFLCMTKKICKYAVKKLPFLIKYGSDPYKAQRIYDRVILENVVIIMLIHNC